MLKIGLVLLLNLFLISSFGQSYHISGVVTDTNNSPISYVNIGIKLKNVGTTTDVKGYFDIEIPEKWINDTLSFTCIGFNDLNLPIKLIYSNSIKDFQLSNKPTELKEVVVTGKKGKEVTVGIKSRSPMLSSPPVSFNKRDILEFAQFIDIKNTPSSIVSTSLMLLPKYTDTVTLRIKFYNVKNGLPFENISDENIIEKIAITKGWLTIDLLKYRLLFDEDFFISYEFLPDGNQHSFHYGARFGGNLISRSSSLGSWTKNKGFSFSSYVTLKKKPWIKKKTILPNIEENKSSSDDNTVYPQGEKTLLKGFGNNDSTGNYASINGIKIYYEIYGEGLPLLLLHGNSESISSFDLQIPELSKHFKVIAVDTRGQGKSTEDGKTYTYDLFAADMNALLNYLKIDSVFVVGWSDGGNTGLVMAMKYPKKVKRLITMGSNVFINNTVIDERTIDTLTAQLELTKLDNSYEAKNRGRLINMILTEPNYTFEDIKVITCPVLVLAGEKDVIKENHTKGIAENIKNSTLFIALNETHYFPKENADLFNKTIIDFLSKKFE